MRFFRSRVLLAAFVASVATALLVGGIAWAVQNPVDGSGVIHGCYSPKDGDIHLNVKGTCRYGETAITWNQTGPQGLPGPKGDPGSVQTHLVTTTDSNFDLAGCATAPCASHHSGYAYCPAGQSVLGGGVMSLGVDDAPSYYANGGAVVVHDSHPAVTASLGSTLTTPQGWVVDLIASGSDGATHVTATFYAICTA